MEKVLIHYEDGKVELVLGSIEQVELTVEFKKKKGISHLSFPR